MYNDQIYLFAEHSYTHIFIAAERITIHTFLYTYVFNKILSVYWTGRKAWINTPFSATSIRGWLRRCFLFCKAVMLRVKILHFFFGRAHIIILRYSVWWRWWWCDGIVHSWRMFVVFTTLSWYLECKTESGRWCGRKVFYVISIHDRYLLFIFITHIYYIASLVCIITLLPVPNIAGQCIHTYWIKLMQQ